MLGDAAIKSVKDSIKMAERNTKSSCTIDKDDIDHDQ
jgi:hypothetical protein